MSSDFLGPTAGSAAEGPSDDVMNAFFEANEATLKAISDCESAIAQADSAQQILESGMKAVTAITALVKAKLATIPL